MRSEINKQKLINRTFRTEDWFEVRTGDKQEAVPTVLFIFLINICFKKICVRRDVEITLAYSGDESIISENKKQIKEVMTRWNDGLKRIKMKISKTKTEVMNINRNIRDININFEGQQLKQVKNFKYLGVIINKNNLQEKKMTNKITTFNENLLFVYQILKDRHVSRSIKLVIYKSTLRPVLT